MPEAAGSGAAGSDRRDRTVSVPAVPPSGEVVFTTIVTHGPMSRIELGSRTGLSSGSVTKAVRPLLEAGLLVETPLPAGSSGRGRPAVPIDVAAERAFILGVKITDTELIGVRTDLRARVLSGARRPLRSRAVRAVVDGLGALVDELTAGADRSHVLRISLAVSGDIDSPGGRVRYSPFLRWHDVPLRSLVESATGLRVVVVNDVRALTVAEQWFGEGRGSDTFALVTVGTGIGCGLLVDGRVVSGAFGVAGELGHVCIDPAGPPCHCGARGCVEAIAGERALLGALAVAAGRPVSMAEAAALCEGDAPAGLRRVLDRAAEAVGVGIASMANLIGPQRVLITGEGLASYSGFEAGLRRAFERHAFGAAGRCELIMRPFGFETWAHGAAAVGVSDLLRPARPEARAQGG